MSVVPTQGWAYAMASGGTLLVPVEFQILASSPAECAEAVCAAACEQSGASWRDLPAGWLTWDQVAEQWGDRIRVVLA
jgi:hypothetical protein